VFDVGRCHAGRMTSSSSSQFGHDELITAAHSGNFGEFLAHAFRASDDAWNVLVDDAAAAHANGQFDLMAAVRRLSKLDYFIREFLQELLPKLALTMTELLALFERLDELSGGQEMAWWRAQVFEKWCEADADRPEIAIQAVERSDAPGELLQPALFAALKVDQRRYLPAVLSLLNGQDEGFRTMAAWTLGRSSCLTGKQLDLAVAELERSLVNVDGSIHAGSLGALISIGVRDGRFAAAAVAAAKTAKPGSGPAVRSVAARELLGSLGAVGNHLVEAVFKLLVDTRADEVETLASIDLIIHNGLKGSHAQSVARLLDHLISRQEIPLKQFDSACHAVLTGDKEQRDGVMLRWLVDGSSPMIKAVHDLIATSHGDPLKFDLDFSSASLSAEQAIVLARKLSESLLIYPVTLASLLLSLIANAPKRAIPGLMRLMYDPLLVNYWMSPREYLEEAAATARPDVAALIAELLQAHRSYSDAIEAADPIPEMWPSDRHRYLVALKDSEERRAISRAAESHSILMSLISKSVVLYGDAAIVGVQFEPGKVVRQESRMQTVEHWQELPRVELIDPVGQWYRRARLASGQDI